MFSKKKALTCTLCIIMCLSSFAVPQVSATEINTVSGYDEITPLMKFIYDADYDFLISNGNAIMYAVVRGNSAKATKCQVTVDLQEKGILFWDTVESWTSIESGRRAELDISYNVSVGKTYRMVTTVTVWVGSEFETQTLTSKSIVA